MKALVITMTICSLTFYGNTEQLVPKDSRPAVSLLHKTLAGDFTSTRAHRQGTSDITVCWSFSEETNVTGYIVERSYSYWDPTDQYSYEEVSNVPATGDRSYQTVDENVFAGYILY